MSLPLVVVLSSLLGPGDDVWSHLWETRLGDLIGNTLGLLLGVLLGTALLGISLAWFAAVYDFPGRRWFEWAMVLPFAFPTYVLGYIYLDLFGLSGPIQQFLRDQSGSVPAWFPDIRSTAGVATVMTIAFYPYVYLLARAAFRTHGRASIEAARSMGCSPWQAFLRVTLPMARPWLFGGLLLVAMETLADFGTVAIFNYDTFTTAIYKAWFSLFSLDAASRLAALLLFFALGLLWLERYSRGRQRYVPVGQDRGGTSRRVLQGGRGWLVAFYFTAVFAVAVVLPLAHLAYWVSMTWATEAGNHYWTLVRHTLMIGSMAALLLCAGALILSYGVRIHPGPLSEGFVSVSTMGYALPGAVLAVGVFLPLAWLDNQLFDLFESLTGTSPEVLLNGTLAVMLAAYFVRFLAVAHQPVQASMTRIKPSLDEAARALGRSRWGVLREIHLPMLRAGLFSAFLLVMIDVMKEMPITLMTRPFGWDTLSIRIFELTSEGEYARAALPSALLVVAGLIPVSLLAKFTGNSGSSEALH